MCLWKIYPGIYICVLMLLNSLFAYLFIFVILSLLLLWNWVFIIYCYILQFICLHICLFFGIHHCCSQTYAQCVYIFFYLGILYSLFQKNSLFSNIKQSIYLNAYWKEIFSEFTVKHILRMFISFMSLEYKLASTTSMF